MVIHLIDVNPMKHGLKVKGGKKSSGWMMSLLLIPILLQLKLIPLFLFKLKFIALKAIAIGKLALALLAFNYFRSVMYGSNDIDDQYKQEVAKEHYGYTGTPEYGAWINRQDVVTNHPYRSHYVYYRNSLT